MERPEQVKLDTKPSTGSGLTVAFAAPTFLAAYTMGEVERLLVSALNSRTSAANTSNKWTGKPALVVNGSNVPQAFVHATGAADTDKWVGTTVAGAAIAYTPA